MAGTNRSRKAYVLVDFFVNSVECLCMSAKDLKNNSEETIHEQHTESSCIEKEWSYKVAVTFLIRK
jgi:hypothetical protein